MDRTHRAEAAIDASDIVVGYTKYVELVEDLTDEKEVISTGMTKEVDRCKAAIEKAAEGNVVSIVSSGDPGVYGMAGLAIELVETEGADLDIEIVPGVSAANSAAALLGAPLSLDYAVISLSDLLVPWEMILERLEAVAKADMVVALYNPKSKKRVTQIEEAAAIFAKHRPAETPVGICDSISLENQNIVISTLGDFLNEKIAMRTTLIIGSTSSTVIDGRIVTARGYKI